MATATEDVFRNLIWPAAAGNVAWSFFSLAIKEQWIADAPRLLALLGIASYLFIAYARLLQSQNNRNSKKYLWADGFLMLTIVVFSIGAAEPDKPWLHLPLAGVFLTSAVAHIFDAWNNANHSVLAFVHLGCLAAVLLLWHYYPSWYWALPLVIGVALGCWLLLTRRSHLATAI